MQVKGAAGGLGGKFMKHNQVIAGVLAAVVLLLGAKPPAPVQHPISSGRGPVQSFFDSVQQMIEKYTEEHALKLRQEGSSHSNYMNGNEWGMFEPLESLTRAEAAQILYTLMEAPPEVEAVFSDVPEGAWYAQAVNSLASAGVICGDEEGNFHPEAPFTRAECAVAAARFLPLGRLPITFVDVPVDHPDYEAICTAAACGLFSRPEDGCFRPDDPLTRAEAAAVFNRLLGRTPDAETIQTSPQVRFFPDVPVTHWAYAQIMEATISHEQEELAEGEHWVSLTEERHPLPDGFHNIDGWLYCARDGKFVRSEIVNGFAFGADGHFTTGNLPLDAKLSEIIRTKTNDTMTQNQKLRAVYGYVRDQFTYIKRKLIAKGQTGWEPAFAEAFLNDGRGNCFGYAATFCLLARELGYDAHTVVGWLGGNRQPHGWVEIVLDGKTYLYDAELEMKYRSSNFFQARYGSTRFDYYKS